MLFETSALGGIHRSPTGYDGSIGRLSSWSADQQVLWSLHAYAWVSSHLIGSLAIKAEGYHETTGFGNRHDQGAMVCPVSLPEITILLTIDDRLIVRSMKSGSKTKSGKERGEN
ncbi:hypothetical protein ElyMa_004004100 [Elysia marginata]|uniref:Uncharacterized protein n=1 Tax=Elysia marginata TaxID=1093978 RepID=A0AAV4FZZ3_9GAST|nr:hypothetical protein ElyMa_004004100 [Elysia marginata]